MNKKDLSERDICTKFITPAVRQAGWDEMTQLREEVSFTKGRIIVRGKLVTRGKAKRADYILYYKPNIPIAIIEAKDNSCSVGDGMQQALDYAETLNIPFVFSSNGDGFVFHDRTGTSAEKESSLSLAGFPSPTDLWEKYRTWKGFTPEAEQIVLQDYFDDGSGKGPPTSATRQAGKSAFCFWQIATFSRTPADTLTRARGSTRRPRRPRDEAVRRAHNGVAKLVLYKGKAVGHQGKLVYEHEYSDHLMIKLLEAGDPDHFNRQSIPERI